MRFLPIILCLAANTAFAQDDEPTYDGTAEAEEAVDKPVTKLAAELGGLYTTGNSYVIAINGGVTGSHKWGQNLFAFGAGVNLNLTRVSDGDDTTKDPIEFTSQRFFGVARYDRFFGKLNSLYLSAGGERDQFAGVLWRFNEQFGYRRVIVGTEATTLDVEVGVAYTQENLTESVDDAGAPLNDAVLDDHYIAARLFLGFTHNFNDHVSIGDAFEMFENLFTPVDLRFTNTAYIAAKLSDRFSIKLSHRLAFDNQPVPDFVKLDQTTAITLVASIF